MAFCIIIVAKDSLTVTAASCVTTRMEIKSTAGRMAMADWLTN